MERLSRIDKLEIILEQLSLMALRRFKNEEKYLSYYYEKEALNAWKLHELKKLVNKYENNACIMFK